MQAPLLHLFLVGQFECGRIPMIAFFRDQYHSQSFGANDLCHTEESFHFQG